MKKLFTLMMAALLAAVVSVGCAQLQSATSLTPNEQMATAITTTTAARKTADTLFKSAKITAAETLAVNRQCDAVIALVQSAHELPAGSAGVATDLQQMAALLASLQTYLLQLQTVPK